MRMNESLRGANVYSENESMMVFAIKISGNDCTKKFASSRVCKFTC